jgi:segregation and condensation protein A
LADYRVNLDIFTGPLDLLLYLVRKEEVDIYDIPLTKIIDQYLNYIEMLKSLDVDLAGDFLVMAATLIQIKSAMLLPKTEAAGVQNEDMNDPRAELIRQLLEYKRFKDAANRLDAVADEHSERFPRSAALLEHIKSLSNENRTGPEGEPEIDMERVSVWDLLEAFDTICKAIGNTHYTGHIKDDTPIDVYQIEILHRLQTEGPMTFSRIFEAVKERVVMVGLFLATLELIRSKLVWAEQPVPSSIYLRSLTEEAPEEAVRKAILDIEAAERQQTLAEQQQQQAPPIPITEIQAEQQPVSQETEANIEAEIESQDSTNDQAQQQIDIDVDQELSHQNPV